LQQYTARLVTGQQELVSLLQAERDRLAAETSASEPIDVSELAELKTRLATTGFTASEIADYESIGFTSADAQVVKDRIAALELPAEDMSLLDMYDDVIDAADGMLTTFTAAADEAGALAASMRSQVQAVSLPTLQLSAPAGPLTAGTLITVTASAGGGTGARTVRWDLDLDGDFDDATGTTAAHTPATASDQLVGARVTDSRGMSTTRFLRIQCQPATAPAQITTQSPEGAHVRITGGASQVFSVEATDPETAPVTYQWFVDDTPVATGPAYTHTTAPGERSIRAISVVASDGDDTHRHVEARWALSTTP
jgi:hypothetical protein